MRLDASLLLIHNVYTVYTNAESQKMATHAVKAGVPVAPRVRATPARVGRTASEAGVSIEVFNIRQARENLPGIVDSVASESTRGVAIGRRGQPDVVVVGYQWISSFLEHGDKKRRFAFLVVDDLLPDAPLHLKAPAIEELARLPMKDLNTLWRLDRLPETKDGVAELQARLAHPQIVLRLVQRLKVATAIRKAREAGLYDMAEDATSHVAGGPAGAAG
jgi:hypothetical protein